jgi:(p)ppGpp synthase/HD superfamily hydrolase
MLQKAIEFACKALAGQFSENGEPYIEHSMRIMRQMDTEKEKMVAILHDVLEDSQTSIYDLQEAGFPHDVIECVDQLTRNNDVTYFEYIDDIATNDICTKIKLAEIEDNKDINRVKKLSFQTYSIDTRCQKVRDILTNR